MQRPPLYLTFFHWLLLAGIITIAIYIAWDLDVLGVIFRTDVTYISAVIVVVFIGASIHCAYSSWFLSHQENYFSEQYLTVKQPKKCTEKNHLKCSPVYNYLIAIKSKPSLQDSTLLSEVLVESLRGSHQVGWFMSNMIIKLGLLGTVVGFVIMLSSVSGLDALDTDDIKQLMQQMTQGMGIAMNTTMVGLVASLLLGIQYLVLDRSADRLVSNIISFSQQLDNELV